MVPQIISTYSHNTTNTTLLSTAVTTQLVVQHEVLLQQVLGAVFTELLNVTVAHTKHIQRHTYESGLRETIVVITTTATGIDFFNQLDWLEYSTFNTCSAIQMEYNLTSSFMEPCLELDARTTGYKETCIAERNTSFYSMWTVLNGSKDDLNRLVYTYGNTTTYSIFGMCLGAEVYQTIPTFNVSSDNASAYANTIEDSCPADNATLCMGMEHAEFQLISLFLEHMAVLSQLDFSIAVDNQYNFSVRAPTLVTQVEWIPSTPAEHSDQNVVLYALIGTFSGLLLVGIGVWFAFKTHTSSRPSSMYEFLS